MMCSEKFSIKSLHQWPSISLRVIYFIAHTLIHSQALHSVRHFFVCGWVRMWVCRASSASLWPCIPFSGARVLRAPDTSLHWRAAWPVSVLCKWIVQVISEISTMAHGGERERRREKERERQLMTEWEAKELIIRPASDSDTLLAGKNGIRSPPTKGKRLNRNSSWWGKREK